MGRACPWARLPAERRWESVGRGRRPPDGFFRATDCRPAYQQTRRPAAISRAIARQAAEFPKDQTTDRRISPPLCKTELTTVGRSIVGRPAFPPLANSPTELPVGRPTDQPRKLRRGTRGEEFCTSPLARLRQIAESETPAKAEPPLAKQNKVTVDGPHLNTGSVSLGSKL